VSDLPALRTEIADLEDQAGQPDLWSDQEAAQKVTSRLAHAQGQLRRIEDLRRRLDGLSADTEAERAVLEARLRELARKIDEMLART